MNPGTNIFDAAAQDLVNLVTEMLESDPELLEARDFDERTPLHAAALGDALATLKLLLSKGANTEAASCVGDRPLHLAQSVTAIQLLVAAGADPGSQDSDGMTPMDWAVRERRRDFFFALTEAWSNLYSPFYQFLAACQKAGLTTDAQIGEEYHPISVDRLGTCGGQEHCLGWRHAGQLAGWKLYPLAQFTDVFFGDPEDEMPEPERCLRPKKALDEIDPYSLPRRWLLIQKDRSSMMGLYDRLDAQELEVTCCYRPGDARKLFREERFDGVIADPNAALVLRDIHTGRLRWKNGQAPRLVYLALTDSEGLEKIPNMFRLDAAVGESEWVEQFMTWLD